MHFLDEDIWLWVKLFLDEEIWLWVTIAELGWKKHVGRPASYTPTRLTKRNIGLPLSSTVPIASQVDSTLTDVS